MTSAESAAVRNVSSRQGVNKLKIKEEKVRRHIRKTETLYLKHFKIKNKIKLKVGQRV
jgi:hypothetical protein